MISKGGKGRTIDLRLYLFILVFIALALVFGGRYFNSAQDPLTITLAESTVSNQSALSHIARAKGFWEEEGLEVNLSSFSAGRLALDAVLSNGAQFGTVAQTPLAMAAFREADYKIIAEITNVSNELSIVARRSSGITSAQNLAGKRVAYFAGTQSDYFLTLFLETNGLSRGDIQEVSISPPDSVSAIVNGDVDAIAVWRPHSLKAASLLGSDAISLPSDGIYTAVMTMISTGDFIKENPEIVEKILRGLIKAEQFLQDNPEEAIEIVARNVQLDRDELSKYISDYTFKVKLSNVVLNALSEQGQWAIDAEIFGSDQALPNYRLFLFPTSLNKVNSDRMLLEDE